MNAAAIWFSSSKALLCLWHVNKAILQRCRPSFAPLRDGISSEMGDTSWKEFYAFWHSIVASPDESTFEKRLAEFKLRYKSEYLDLVGYIKMYYIQPPFRQPHPFLK
jgi:hypothetical protein